MNEEILFPIYQKIPDALIPVFDSCLKKRNEYSRRKQFETLELAAIVGERTHSKNTTLIGLPETYYLHELNALRGKIRNRIFGNPLVENFIQMKFDLIRGFVCAGVVLHVSY